MRPAPPEKGVTWEELFFDLAFVAALTQFSGMLHADHSWAGVGRVLLLFVTIYWAWAGTAIYTDQRNVSNPVDRAGIFALGLGSLLLALMIPGAYGDRSRLFAGVYVAMRVVLAALALHSLGWRSPVLRSYGSGLVAGPLQLAAGNLPGTTRIVLWSLAVLTDVVGTWITRRPLATVSVRPLHYTHRYGLLIILVLGESVIEVGIAAVDQPLTPARLSAIGIAYTLVCTLWWAYFIYGVRAFRQAVERTAEQADLRRSVMVYGHVLFSFGIIMVAVGLAEVVMAPVEPFRPDAAALLFGGAALFLTTFAYTHWRIKQEIAWRRISAGALCLVLLPLAPLMPALAALTTLLAVVVGLNVLEELILHPSQDRAAENATGPRQGDQGPAMGN